MALKFINKSFLSIKNAQSLSPLLFYSTQVLEEKLVKNSKGHSFLTDMQNDKFEKFYKAQNVCSEEDFPAMMKSFRSGLPSVFRQVKHSNPKYFVLMKTFISDWSQQSQSISF